MSFVTSRSPLDSTIVKSPGDRLDYCALRLDNGLQVLLAHDPDADRASAAMNVATGSAFNPERFPGLAHFLEHMLFLGTDRYPDPDEYHRYLGEHGGHHNAFTAPRDTNYFFDIDPEAFEGALDRFSRFFIAPTLDTDYVERERRAVHSEYQARLQDDARRIEDALNETLNPVHPFNRFSMGNLDTLRDYPDQSLRDALKTFLTEHYDANTMQLVLLGPQPLSTLAALAERCFSEVPDHGLPLREIDTPVISAERLPLSLSVQSLQHQQQVRFLFPMPDPEADFRLKPASFLADLIGHEGEGSLLSHLRRLGWADGLAAGSARADGRRSLFTVSLELTPAGAEHLDDIQASLMAWIALIRRQGLARWRFEEQASLAAQQFDFQQRLPPSRQATALSMAMARYPLAEIKSAPHLMTGFDAATIEHYLSSLKADNLLRLYSGPEVEGEHRSRWFDTPWRFEATDGAPTGRAIEGLALPPANDFIATDFTQLPFDEGAPRALIDEPGFDLWYRPESRFGSPRVEWRLSLQSPEAGCNVREAVLTELLAHWLDDSLVEALYAARLAGQNSSVHPHARGMTLTFAGWRDRQWQVIDRLLDQLVSAEIEPQEMARAVRELERKWLDEPFDPLHEQMQRALTRALIVPTWQAEARLEALRTLDLDELRRFRTRWLARLHVQGLAVGNLDAASAQAAADLVRSHLAPRIPAADIPDLKVASARDEPPMLRPVSRREDSAVLRYLQGEGRSLDDRARLALLGQLIDAPFFNRLRTEEQLGYIVAARYQPLLEAPGLMLLVQSPGRSTATLIERIEHFLAGFDETVAALDETTLAPYRQAVYDRLREREQRLGQLASGLWQDLAQGYTDFDRRERLASRTAAQGAADIQRAWRALRARPRLDVGFEPDRPANQNDAPWQPALVLPEK